MKKMLLIIGVVLISLSVFQTTINFWTIQLKPTYTKYFNELISEYYKATGVKINWIDITYNNYLQNYYTLKDTTLQPDVMNVNTNMLIDLYLNDEITDITQYQTSFINEYESNMIKSVEINNKLYQIPWYITPQITIVNTSILRAYGIDTKTNSDLYSPDTIMNVIEKQSRNMTLNAMYVLYVPNIIGFDYLVLNHVDILNKEGTKAQFQDNQKQISILNKLITLRNVGQLPILDGYATGKQYYINGKLQFYPVGVSYLNLVIQNKSKSVYNNTQILPPIQSEDGLQKMAPMSFTIPKNSNKQKEQIDFIKFLTSADKQIDFQKYQTIIPSTVKGIESDSYFEEHSDNLLVAGQLMANRYKGIGIDTNVVHNIPLKYFAKIYSIINNYFLDQIRGFYSQEEQLQKQQDEVNIVLGE